jgi:CHAT domain-containing protein
MNAPKKKAISAIVLTLSLALMTFQKANGQFGLRNLDRMVTSQRQLASFGRSALHDSIRGMVSYIIENAIDEKLRKTALEVQQLYEKDNKDNRLQRRLLEMDYQLIKPNSAVNKQIVHSFSETLVKLFNLLPPKGEHAYYALSINNLASLYMSSGRYEKARPLYEQAMLIREKTLSDKHPEYATSLSNLAFLYHKQGMLNDALPLYTKAVKVYKKTLGEMHPYYATALDNLGSVYMDLGLFSEAKPLYEQAMSIREKTLGDLHTEYARSLNNFGSLLCQMGGHYDKALSIFERALAIRKHLGEEHPDYITSLSNLAWLYATLGQTRRALSYYEQALAISKKNLGEEHPAFASTLNNLAGLYFDLEHYDKALPIFERALAIRKHLGEEHPDYIESLSNLASLYAALRLYDKALPLFERALVLCRKVFGESHVNYALSLNNFGNFYFEQGQYKKALPYFEDALELNKKVLPGVNPPSLNRLGMLYALTGRTAKAYSLFADASHALINHLNSTYSTLSEQEKVALLNTQFAEFSLLPSLLFTQGTKQSSLTKLVYANELVLKAMVLQDQQQVLRSVHKSNDNTVLQLYNRWRLNRAIISKEKLLPLAKRSVYLDSLEEATNKLEQQLSQLTASLHTPQQSGLPILNNSYQKIKEGEAAIEVIRFRLYNEKWTDSILYAAIVALPTESTPHFVPLFEEKQLEALLKPTLSPANVFDQISAVQKLYSIPNKGTSKVSPSSLYQLLWKNLEPYLEGIHTLYYAPTGLLHRVAINAIQINPTQRVIDTYKISQVWSTRSVTSSTQQALKPNSISLWGSINYNNESRSIGGDTLSVPKQSPIYPSNVVIASASKITGNGWQPLPHTKKEINSLVKLFQGASLPVTVDSGSLATEESFKALSGRSPQVLHVATHGFFLPAEEIFGKENSDTGIVGKHFETFRLNSMLRSGLVLAGANLSQIEEPTLLSREDGILTAYEVSQIDLNNTDVIVLSACETALGDVHGSEGVIGLQRAFKLAGVKKQIISLWPVPDQETTELMIMFYRNLLSGYTPKEALRNAQLSMKKTMSEKSLSPFFWAAFILIE